MILRMLFRTPEFLGFVLAATACALAGAADGESDLLTDLLQRERLTGDWFGARTDLEERGIAFAANVTVDWTQNFRGGMRTGSGAHHLFAAGLALDMERLLDFTDGAMYVEFQTNSGDMLSSDLVGDLQIFSNIKDEHHTQLAELWYEHAFGDIARIKIGKVDANTEFAFVEHGLDFLNSSMGFSPTIFVLPTYPDPAMSVNFFLYPQDFLYMGIGIYDGAGARGVRTGSRGPSTFFHSLSDLFLIGEAGVLWGEQSLPGRIGFGAWHHTGRFERFDGSRTSGTDGFFLTFDQMIWRADTAALDYAEPHIGVFLQYGYADARISEFEHHVGGGIVCRGIVPGRGGDAFGFGVTWVRLSGDADFDQHSETAFELFYQAEVLPWLIVQPDLQFIRNPGGTSENRNALVGTLRFGIEF